MIEGMTGKYQKNSMNLYIRLGSHAQQERSLLNSVTAGTRKKA